MHYFSSSFSSSSFQHPFLIYFLNSSSYWLFIIYHLQFVVPFLVLKLWFLGLQTLNISNQKFGIFPNTWNIYEKKRKPIKNFEQEKSCKIREIQENFVNHYYKKKQFPSSFCLCISFEKKHTTFLKFFFSYNLSNDKI